MSRKTVVLVIFIVLSLLVGGFVGFYFYLYNKTGDTSSIIPRPTGFFGFFTRDPQPVQISTTTEQVISNPAIQSRPVPRLRKITSEPVAGAAFVMKDVFATTTQQTSTSTKSQPPRIIGKQEVIRWMERGSGNIFETSTSSLGTARISNTTVSQVYEAYFTDKGDSVLTRKVLGVTDNIETRFGRLQTITPTSTEQTLSFVGLPLNITEIALSPDKTRLFTINQTDPVGQISRTDGSNRTNVFNFAFHEWLVQWPATSSVILTTKPSGKAQGFSYLFNPQNTNLSKIIGNKNGLTTLSSPDTNKLLYGEAINGSYQIGVLDRKTGRTLLLYFKTFPEKCVWSLLEKDSAYCAIPDTIPYSTYPDAWYQGRVAFSDSIWKINTATGETREILPSFIQTDEALDMTKLTLSTKEDYLLFRNKSDLSLWGYQLIVPTRNATSTATSTTATTTRR